MFTTHQKGEIAQLKIQIRAAEKGVLVSRPTTEARYDIVLDIDGKLIRAQIKYSDHKPSKSAGSKGCIEVRLSRETRGNGKQRTYSKDEVDVILVYLPRVDKIVWLNPDEFHGKASVSLRIEPTRNGQMSGVKMISDYEW